MKRTIALVCAIILALAVLPVMAFAADMENREVVDHADVNFSVTDLDYSSVIPVDQGGTGMHSNSSQRYMYLSISENSGMFAAGYHIHYPAEFVTITADSSTWTGGLIQQIEAAINAGTPLETDLFSSVCNTSYEGQTGGFPVGEAGEIYIRGGMYLRSANYGGLQLGGNYHRFTIRLDVTPTEDDCLHDEYGYYLPFEFEFEEFEYMVYNENGSPVASPNWADPENSADAPWLTCTDGKLYVTPIASSHPTVYGVRAEIRARATDDSMKDLRFVFNVDFYDSYVVYNGVTYGVASAPCEINRFWSVLTVEGNSVTVNGANIFAMYERYFTYTAVVKGVKEANFNTVITATPYLTYTSANGVEHTIDGSTITASVNSALNN